MGGGIFYIYSCQHNNLKRTNVLYLWQPSKGQKLICHHRPASPLLKRIWNHYYYCQSVTKTAYHIITYIVQIKTATLYYLTRLQLYTAVYKIFVAFLHTYMCITVKHYSFILLSPGR